MRVERWKGLVRPFHSQEIFVPTVITLPSPHLLQPSRLFPWALSSHGHFFLKQQKPASLSHICPFWLSLVCLGPRDPSSPWSTACLCSAAFASGCPFLHFPLPPILFALHFVFTKDFILIDKNSSLCFPWQK